MKMKGGPLWIIGTDTVKTVLMSRLARGGKAIRFSNTLKDVYYEQLTAERLCCATRADGRPTSSSAYPGCDNQAWDALVCAYAAREALTIPLEAREEALKAKPDDKPKPKLVQREP
jgi:phage terminase large subunit GpA-like protein